MRYIKNFVDMNPVTVSATNHQSIGPLVTISQSFGSLNFNHSMTPAQAIEMADALLESAASLQHGVLTVPAKVVSHAE